MRKILPSSLEELITRDHCRPMKTLVQEINISITNAVRKIVLEDLRYLLLGEDNHVRSQARGRRTGSMRTSWRCGTRRFGLPAHLITAFWTVLCGAFLSYSSVQSLTTKSRT
jgi:hypothetical protein